MNARVETLTQRPAFRGLLSHNRCLVPASGFYEWQGEGRAKMPYDIHPGGQPYLAFAGLYDFRQGPLEWCPSAALILKKLTEWRQGLAHALNPPCLSKPRQNFRDVYGLLSRPYHPASCIVR
jgi:SOS response associated peptidase (SRAP)